MCMESSPNVSSIYSVSFGFIWYNSDSSQKLIYVNLLVTSYDTVRSLLPMSAVGKTRPLVASNTSCDLLWQTLAISVLWQTLLKTPLWQTLAISCHSWNHEKLYTRCQWLNSEKWETVLTSQFHHGQWPLVMVCKCLRPFPDWLTDPTRVDIYRADRATKKLTLMLVIKDKNDVEEEDVDLLSVKQCAATVLSVKCYVSSVKYWLLNVMLYVLSNLQRLSCGDFDPSCISQSIILSCSASP